MESQNKCTTDGMIEWLMIFFIYQLNNLPTIDESLDHGGNTDNNRLKEFLTI